MRKVTIGSVCAFAALQLTQCAPMVAFPPSINLTEYEMLGLVKFSCNKEGELDEFVTQRCLENMIVDQMGVRILELGLEKELLAEAGYESMNPSAISAIGERHNVKSLVLGSLTVDNVKTRINLATILTSLHVRAEVEATLAVRMVETSSGATIWTNSARMKRTIGGVHAYGDGTVFFDAEDPEEAYGDLVNALVNSVTEDFRVTYRRMRR